MNNSGVKNLGKLISVELRDFWEDEARDFTPWLAKEENLKPDSSMNCITEVI